IARPPGRPARQKPADVTAETAGPHRPASAPLHQVAASSLAGPRRGEFQRDAVHAVAQAGRRRTIRKYVAEMAAAAAAMHLGAFHQVGVVLGGADRLVERAEEARPTGMAFELGVRGEQRQVAARADEGTLALLL